MSLCDILSLCRSQYLSRYECAMLCWSGATAGAAAGEGLRAGARLPDLLHQVYRSAPPLPAAAVQVLPAGGQAAARGCASREKQWAERCESHEAVDNQTEQLCYCSFNLCNHSQVQSTTNYIPLLYCVRVQTGSPRHHLLLCLLLHWLPAHLL